MTEFSANLGFLWADRPLPEAIRLAHAAGFKAVELHWPYATSAVEVRDALADTGLRLMGLNTRRGDVGRGENGLSALPGREGDARAAIDEALGYADAAGAGAVHVMAGFSGGPRAHDAFLANLAHACDQAPESVTILIEPLNHYDAPGYFLSTCTGAAAIIRELGRPNLRIMVDCYHLQIMEGDVSRRLTRLLPLTGHIQIAAVPDRGPPDHGELNYPHLLAHLARLGWQKPIGAEYRPGPEGTDATLGWLGPFRAIGRQ
ncbi:MAG: TIM barrel protein [Pseudomonadota bacterium]